jgi:hypothetical protein
VKNLKLTEAIDAFIEKVDCSQYTTTRRASLIPAKH